MPSAYPRNAFSAFRRALTSAAQQMLAQESDASVGDIADSVVQDIVRPELAKIEQRLRLAKQVLARKSVSLALGSLAATCGLLLGVSPGVAEITGIAAFVAGSGTAGAKYVDEKEQIELWVGAFLWKALIMLSSYGIEIMDITGRLKYATRPEPPALLSGHLSEIRSS